LFTWQPKTLNFLYKKPHLSSKTSLMILNYRVHVETINIALAKKKGEKIPQVEQILMH